MYAVTAVPITPRTRVLARCVSLLLPAFYAAQPLGETISHDQLPSGDRAAQAIAHVYTQVAPNILLEAVDSISSGSLAGVDFVTSKNLGSIQTGYIHANITFQLKTNNQDFNLACAATDLFKGAVPDPEGALAEDASDDPIALDVSYGCRIQPSTAYPIGGVSTIAPFGQSYSTLTAPQGLYWRFNHSSSIHFESYASEATQSIALSLRWYQGDAAKKQGIYSGFVKLVGWLPGYEAKNNCDAGNCL